MLDLLTVALLQAAAGEPSPTPQIDIAPIEQAAPSKKAKQDGDRIVCREFSRTGTRFTERRCYRARDADERRQADQDALKRQQRPSGPRR